ncbi:MAG: amidohydrolase family protein [Lachnospiraceae bacterium]|nr:amidohydrolase family protein [Lachnospiraceae bacterium]
MFGECHAHLFMNGKNYREAVALHKNGVQEQDIREKLRQYQEQGVTFLREGGDVLGVSARAALLAPEYGITYRSPVFAIHKNGHYGGIVGYGFDTMKEYHQLIKRAEAAGADFIKVMFSGIMDFSREGHLTEEPLDRQDIQEMIHIAHEEGFAVMAHVNGAEAVRNAVEAGVDSVEHGNFADEECLWAMAESHAVWVPTYVTITNLIGSGRFDDAALLRLKERQGERIRRGYELGVKIALGSDAGAFCVPHGQGILDEYRELGLLLGAGEELDEKFEAAENEIRRRFVRG